jgi:U3 small nucleolar RNA-associated protein 25
MPNHSDMTSSLEEIRPYFYENLSKFYRQNIFYSEFIFPEMNSLRNRIMENYRGSVMNKPFYYPVFKEE